MNNLEPLKKVLKKYSSIKKAKLLQRFFKTGIGEYGEGDKFIGITVPETREVAKRFRDLPLMNIKELLMSDIHEERLCALLILVDKYQKSTDKEEKERIVNFYLNNTSRVNNWDLVDLTAHKILGAYLHDNNDKKRIIYDLSKSGNLWERRISVIATFYFIGKKDYTDALMMAEIHLNDKHDLMHKAVGWMLREIGKRDKKKLIKFLDKNYKIMPRTMLRYSIEKLSDKEREYYLGR